MAKIRTDLKPTSNQKVYKKDQFISGTSIGQPFGVFNFRGANLQKYNDYCFTNNLDRDNVTVQTEFLLKLLNEDASLNGARLKKANSVEEAVQIVHEYILQDTNNVDRSTDIAYDLLERNS